MSSHAETHELARRLQQATPATAADLRRELLLYWYGFGGSHLLEEDEALLDIWERHGGADHPLNAAIRAEHTRLSREVGAIAADVRPAPEALRRFGTALAAYVRCQERELTSAVAASMTR